jgi:hypothetical protein
MMAAPAALPDKNSALNAIKNTITPCTTDPMTHHHLRTEN